MKKTNHTPFLLELATKFSASLQIREYVSEKYKYFPGTVGESIVAAIRPQQG